MTILSGGPFDGRDVRPRAYCRLIEIPELELDPIFPPFAYHQYKPDGTYIGPRRSWTDDVIAYSPGVTPPPS